MLRVLGEGGMGVVFSAIDDELARPVAIKLLRGGRRGHPQAHARLTREAQALAKLSHPNVVAIHDVGVVDGRVWLAMEFVEGDTLTVWARAGTRTWREVLALSLIHI